MKQLTAIVAAGLAMTVSAAPAAGVYYEAISEAETGQASTDYARMKSQAWIEGDSVKVVFVDSNNPLMSEGSWLLTRDGGETVYRVNPRTETYMVWDEAGLMGSLAGVYKALEGMVELSLEDTAVEKQTEEEGPSILGYDTIHSTYETSYTLVMKIMGSVQRVVTDTRQEIWTTDAVDAPIHGVWLSTRPPTTGIDDLDRFIDEEMAKVTSGFPLKTVIVTTTTSQGRTATSKSTTEVTVLEERDIDDEIFTIPPGYRRVEMPGLEELMQQQ